MPTPRIFVSSTCYDLKYVRENLKFFIRSLGYEPILSEEGGIFYDPQLHVADACFAEVPTCDLFVLIIGGRFGSRHLGKSITNGEYDAAAKVKIPIFALVERDVLEQSRVYYANSENLEINKNSLIYPAVDSTEIFDFIKSVQSNSVNNALVPFSDFEEIQNYLKKQWAAMFHQYLTTASESKRVTDILAVISQSTDNIEFVTRQLLNSTGNPIAKLKVDLYDYLIQQGICHDLAAWNIQPSPQAFLIHETLDSLCNNQIQQDDDDERSSLTYGGPPYRCSPNRAEQNRKDFQEIRAEILQRIAAAKISLGDFLKDS